MKALLCEKPGSFAYITKNEPAREKGRAILKIKRIGICGTDLHAFEGTQPYFEYPRILGHELACEVAEIDNGKEFSTGDKVTFIPYFNCGECVACRNGLTNCCVNMKVCGVHVDGGMAEYLSVPAKSLIHGGDLSYDELALVEPLSIGAHAVRRAGIKYGEYILVVGAGPIGLGVMEFARVAGAHVIAMDTNEKRLDFCKKNMRGVVTLNPAQEDAVQKLRDLTDGDMPTVVFDATGSLRAINTAFQFMAHGARYVLVGLQKDEISFSHPEFHKREATLMSSRNATREDFEHVMRCMQYQLVNPKHYITHRVQFDEVKDNFESWLNASNGVIKAMVEI
jgi:2-desacetyl-2-hydroxyethyl bacteriochlorophyllide A dehydrogenase